MRSTVVALLAVLVAMVSVQTGASLAKRLFPLAGSTGATALRLVLSTAILVAIFRPWRAVPDRAGLLAIARYGAALGAMNLSFYLSLRTLPLGVAVALEFTGPLAVAVLGSRRALDLLWVALAAAGIVLVLPAGAASVDLDLAGVVWALVAGACWGLYIHFGKRASTAGSGGVVTALGMVAASCVAAPIGVIGAGARLLDPAILPLGLGVAVLSSAVPYSLEMVGLARLPARTFGILMSLEPALAALSGWVLLDEHLTPRQLAAVACVMVASFGSTLGVASRGGREAPLPTTRPGRTLPGP